VKLPENKECYDGNLQLLILMVQSPASLCYPYIL